ncbi:hypothetical protein FHG87_022652 [Trinorchestia longiramus]|nr:hypothetical protein FHG87_022652 [Trinorchestia longiramus]
MLQHQNISATSSQHHHNIIATPNNHHITSLQHKITTTPQHTVTTTSPQTTPPHHIIPTTSQHITTPQHTATTTSPQTTPPHHITPTTSPQHITTPQHTVTTTSPQTTPLHHIIPTTSPQHITTPPPTWMLSRVAACSMGTEWLYQVIEAAGRAPLTSHLSDTSAPSPTGGGRSCSTSTLRGSSIASFSTLQWMSGYIKSALPSSNVRAFVPVPVPLLSAMLRYSPVQVTLGTGFPPPDSHFSSTVCPSSNGPMEVPLSTGDPSLNVIF